MLGPADVLPGVADIVREVEVEAVFDDGTRLVVVADPIGGGQLGAAGPGAVSRREVTETPKRPGRRAPGGHEHRRRCRSR